MRAPVAVTPDRGDSARIPPAATGAALTPADDDPRPAAAEAAPADEDEASGVVQGLKDITLAPVRAIQGHARWLRAALVVHLVSTIAAWLVAWRLHLPDTWLYVIMGLATWILVANFVRWRPEAGVIRRWLGTVFGAVTVLGWAVLLADRAWGPVEVAGQKVADHGLFWVPTGLLAASALLLLHLAVNPRPQSHAHARVA